jgi:hypothetical protein
MIEIIILTMGFMGVSYLSYLAGYCIGRDDGLDDGFEAGKAYQKEVHSLLKGRMND